MKKFLLCIVGFFAIIVVIDSSFGKVCSYMIEHSMGGETKAFNDLCRKQEYDFLIMGSSQAHHNYDTKMISDSLGIRVYNAGKDGNGIVLATGIYNMISRRYHPKKIIYNVTPEFDIYKYAEDKNNHRYIGKLKPYFSEKGIRDIFRLVDPKECVKMRSGLYAYNSEFFNIFQNFIRPTYKVDEYGYVPLYGEIPDDYIVQSKTVSDIDPLKLKMFSDFVCQVKRDGTELVVVFSPEYKAVSSDIFNPIKDICTVEGIEVWDYYTDSRFTNSKELSKDVMHLNAKGAEAFTKEIINQVRIKL